MQASPIVGERSRRIAKRKAAQSGAQPIPPLQHPDPVQPVRHGDVFLSLASIPSRVESLHRVVDALYPQVGRMQVALNGYDGVPSFLDRPNIAVLRSQDIGDLGDANKFAGHRERGDYYHLTADDDLDYPPDYVAEMVRAIDRYDRRAIVSFHGAQITPRLVADYHSRAGRMHCQSYQARDVSACVVGTGVMGYHASEYRLDRDLFPTSNMADVHLALYALDNQVPLVVVAHEANWIRAPMPAASIFASSRARDGSAMDVSAPIARVLAGREWRPRRLPRTVAVTVTTYDRDVLCAALVRKLADLRESSQFNVALRVVDDASPNYPETFKACFDRDVAFQRHPDHCGKANHWRIVDRILGDCMDYYGGSGDVFMFLPDDFEPSRDLIGHAVEYWDALPIQSRGTLSLVVHKQLEHVPCWTGVQPRVFTSRSHRFAEIGYVDGMYVCDRSALTALTYHIDPIVRDWDRCPWLGSGVGQQMSRRLLSHGLAMYRTDVSLLRKIDVPSKMNAAAESHDGEDRYVTVRFIDDLP